MYHLCTVLVLSTHCKITSPFISKLVTIRNMSVKKKSQIPNMVIFLSKISPVLLNSKEKNNFKIY
jgi:hypothetical protein